MTKLFVSYARGDDETFVRRLYDDLMAAHFDGWLDRVSMPSRQLTFHQEIRDAVANSDRLLLVLGPKASTSDYVTQEWRFALEMGKCVNPIVRLNGLRGDGQPLDGYELMPEELKLIHAEDFRDDSRYPEHLANLVRQLSDPVAPLGKLVAVPSLPEHYRAQPERLKALREALLIDLQRPIVVTGAAAHVGVHGMPGIGKSVLAMALARDLEVRRAFPDGVFWIHVGQQPNIPGLQRTVVKELGGDAMFNLAHEGKQRLRELLEKRAALVILDDVWNSADADAFDVVGPRCKLIMTTRDAGLVTAMTGTGYQVQLPSEAEAMALLATAARIPLDMLPRPAREVVAECGRLPLAIALCGGMVQAGTPWQDLLDGFREHDLAFVANDRVLEEQHRNVWRAMDMSVRVLSDEQRLRFTELAVFAPGEKVPEAAVLTLWAHTGGVKERNARQMLIELERRSLVQVYRSASTAESGGGTMAVHDLLHDFAVQLAEDRFGTLKALHEQLLDAYQEICPNGWSGGPNDGYFFEQLSWHMAHAGRWSDLESLLFDLRFMETKIASGLSHRLAADYVYAAEEYDTVSHLAEGASIAACLRQMARLFADVMEKIQAEPNSTGAQLFLELQKRGQPGSSDLACRLETALSGCSWIKHHATHGRPAVPYRAQMAVGNKYIHSLRFSSDGQCIAFADLTGTVSRWHWNTPHLPSIATPPPTSRHYRLGGLASDKRFLLADETELWVLRVDSVWDGDLSRGTWHELHTLSHTSTICNVSTSPETDCSVIALTHNGCASLLVYRGADDRIVDEWPIPMPAPENFINYVAFSTVTGAKAVCFGGGELLFSTGVQVLAHGGGVFHCVFLNDGSTVASCGDDGTCAIWDLRGRLLRRVELVHGSAECLSYHPQRHMLFIGHRSGHVSYFTVTGDGVGAHHSGSFFPGVSGWVLSMAVSECGSWIAVSGRNGVVRIFEIDTVMDFERDVFNALSTKPLHQVNIWQSPIGCFFMDGQRRLLSTLKTRDTRYIPLRCNCACFDSLQTVVFAALTNELRVLRADTGEPLHCHAMEAASRISMAFDSNSSRLAVLERTRVVVYGVNADYSVLTKRAVIPLDDMLREDSCHRAVLRDDLPIAFCGNDQVVVPLERAVFVHLSERNEFASPDLHHRVAIVDIQCQTASLAAEYEGFCTALTVLPNSANVLLGLGDFMVPALKPNGESRVEYSVVIESPKSGVMVLDKETRAMRRFRHFVPEDMGVCGIAAWPGADLLAVAFRSGRVRLGSLQSGEWVSSICLDYPAMAVTFTDQAGRLLIADDGGGTAFWPVVHEFDIISDVAVRRVGSHDAH